MYCTATSFLAFPLSRFFEASYLSSNVLQEYFPRFDSDTLSGYKAIIPHALVIAGLKQTVTDVLADEAKRVFEDEGNITTEGQLHLGAVIRFQKFKDPYCREKVLGWKEEFEALSEIARSQPHAAYTVFTNGRGYKFKFTYFMHTVSSFEY